MTDLTAPPEPTIPVRWLTPDGVTLERLVTDAQLRGNACMLCHSTGAILEDSGHVYGEVGGGWRAKTCTAGDCEVQA
ncbi:hypothetical protein [Streptacidiphilus fuscans]|uniref:Uncharacterized protein n=1 Tax=Streptacidiphilus fuscans TaxID=2789292 RepID=A0A931B5P3_9ACTN|nr:hypothetical protein [Streptacidiphilus fuscans]MBF9069907.1 hypothetical protein [Streptacidiphilus fuscans]